MTDIQATEAKTALEIRRQVRNLISQAGSMSGMEFINQFLDHPEAPQMVQSMEPVELYHLVLHLGRGDSGELVRYATTEQFHGIIDLDCWDANEYRPERLEAWLALAAEGGEDSIGKVLDAIDDEQLGLYVLSRAQVIARIFEPEEDDALPDGQDVITTPDNLFYIVLPPESPYFASLRFFITEWYAQDHIEAASVLKSIATEDADILGADARRFRDGRLPSMGFPTYEEASRLLKYINPRRLKERLQQKLSAFAPFSVETSGLLPVIRDFHDAQPEFLSKALRDVENDPLRERIQHGFVYLINAVAIIDTEGDLGNSQRREQSAVRAFSITNLALQYLSDSDAMLAAYILPRVWPKHLFQIGIALLTQLKTKAQSLNRMTGADAGFFLFDPPLDQVITGAIEDIPMYFDGLLDETKRTHRDFRTFEDWRITRGALNQAKGVAEFVDKILAPNPLLLANRIPTELRPSVTHTTLMATALINAMLGKEHWMEPIPPSELTEVLDLILLPQEGGDRVINPNLREALKRFIEKEDNRFAAVLFELALAKIQDTFLRLPRGVPPEPRFVAGTILVG